MFGILLVRLVSWFKTKKFDSVSAQTTSGIFLEIRMYDYSSDSQTVFCGSQRKPHNFPGDREIFLYNDYIEV